MSGIAQQILSDATSQTPAPVNANSEENTEVTPQQPSKSDDFDSRFAILTKMERKIREREEQFKSRDKEFEESRGKMSEYEEFMKLMDENPIEAIKKRKGWGLQELNEFAVKNSSDDDLDPIARIHKTHDEKMNALKEELEKSFTEKLTAKEQEIKSREYEGQVKQFQSDIKTFLIENKDTFEFVNSEPEGPMAVYELIYEDILRQKEAEVPDDELKVMDMKTASEMVEAYFEKQFDSQYNKLLGLKKVQSRIRPEENLGRFITQSEPKTLNSSFSPKSKSVDQLSEKERRQAAIDLISSQQPTN